MAATSAAAASRPSLSLTIGQTCDLVVCSFAG
jgi:hypothetical protein